MAQPSAADLAGRRRTRRLRQCGAGPAHEPGAYVRDAAALPHLPAESRIRVDVLKANRARRVAGWPSRHNSIHMAEFEPIRIVGIIDSEISSPRNDGTAGSALYNIPFQLSQKPPVEWADYFPRAWDHPSSWTSSHRSGMVQVVGDRIWLNGTTIEEVEIAHKATLQLVLDETNREYGEYLSEQNLKQETELEGLKSSEIQVREAARRIKFD